MDSTLPAVIPLAESAIPPVLVPEEEPNIDHIIIEDGAPVDGILTERQMDLLTEPLYVSWEGPGEGRTFVALTNVGLFFSDTEPPLVPDALLSVDVKLSSDLKQKKHNTYFVWVFGKMPDVVMEIVSNLVGGEDTRKLRDYARLGIPYYVIFDPVNYLKAGPLRVYGLVRGKYELMQDAWLPQVGLGLVLWTGHFKGFDGQWLRWCDRQGRVLPTGVELAEQQKERVEQETQRAEQETQRAEQEKQRAEKLAAQLRALGVEPTS